MPHRQRRVGGRRPAQRRQLGPAGLGVEVTEGPRNLVLLALVGGPPRRQVRQETAQQGRLGGPRHVMGAQPAEHRAHPPYGGLVEAEECMFDGGTLPFVAGRWT